MRSVKHILQHQQPHVPDQLAGLDAVVVVITSLLLLDGYKYLLCCLRLKLSLIKHYSKCMYAQMYLKVHQMVYNDI